MGRKKLLPEESTKHAMILTMASQMFMEHGYSAISMDALAEAVPVSKRTLYNHFSDKKALFTAVMQSRCKTVFDALSKTIHEGLSVEETLTILGKRYLSVIFEPDAINIYRVALTEAQQFPELGKLFFESGPKRSVGLLTEYFELVHTQGELHIPHPELAANIFMGMLSNRLQMKCMLGIQKKVSAKVCDDIVKYAVRLFINGHQGKA